MSTDKVAPFDPQSLAGALRERVRDSLGMLIPDEQWDAMMQREINAFFTPEPDRYGQTRAMSGFGSVVLSVAQEEGRKRLLAYVETSPDWQSRFGAGGTWEPSKALSDALDKAMPTLLENAMRGFCKGLSNHAAQFVVESLRRG